MTTTKWKCPKHNVALRTIEDYPGALVHGHCPDIFTVIKDNLCILDGTQWRDVKTGEIRKPTPSK